MLGLKCFIERCRMRKKFFNTNTGVVADNSLTLRLPQYIQCGQNVIIGTESKLLCWDSNNNKVFKKRPEIKIGNNFHATRRLTIQCANKVIIGNNALFASDVFLVDYNHGTNPNSANYLDNDLDISEGIFIDDGVWIGNNVIILGGVKIGEKTIIGAGSVVTHSIPAYCIAVGNPAKVIKRYNFNNQTWENIDGGVTL